MRQVPVFLINLDRSTDRLHRMRQRLEAAGLEWTRISAVDGQQALEAGIPDYTDVAALAVGGRRLRPGEIGCYLSHREAAQRVADSGAEWGLVLEDDAVVPPDMAARLQAIIAALPEDTDLVNLGRPPRHGAAAIDADLGLMRAYYFPVTTTALLWRAEAAHAFCALGHPLTLPVDLFLQDWMTRTARGAALLQPPVPADDSTSVIYTGHRTGEVPDKLRYHLKRLGRLLRNRLNAIR
ncbi:hypothetical protein MASR2M74_36620 [Paracoccaceae bacterium]